MKEVTFLFLSCLALSVLALTARAKSRGHRLEVQAIQHRAVTPQESREGYDTKVVVTVMPYGIPPDLSGRRYMTNDIECCKGLQIIRRVEGRQIPLNVKPHVEVRAATPIVLSFLMNSHRLPAGQLFLRGSVAHSYVYDSAKSGKPWHLEKFDQVIAPFEIAVR